MGRWAAEPATSAYPARYSVRADRGLCPNARRKDIEHLAPSKFFMKPDPKLPVRFARNVLTELALIRGELFAQRKLLIELTSHITKEPRREIKERTYRRSLRGLSLRHKLEEWVGLQYHQTEGLWDGEEKEGKET